jgi:hypothetical protein
VAMHWRVVVTPEIVKGPVYVGDDVVGVEPSRVQNKVAPVVVELAATEMGAVNDSEAGVKVGCWVVGVPEYAMLTTAEGM